MTTLFIVALGLSWGALAGVQDGGKELREAVTLYASFDAMVAADRGGGELMLATRSNDPATKGAFLFKPGFDDKVFRIARGKGIHGGALEVVDVLPNNGRIFFPAKGNLAYRKTGWGGAVSVWINTDPNTLLKTPFCDPVQITQKGANNGGIWFDFNAARPRRDLRMGAFPAVAEGQKGVSEDDANAPMVRVLGVDFKAGQWHHVVVSWRNFDTGKDDAQATLYIDGAHRRRQKSPDRDELGRGQGGDVRRGELHRPARRVRGLRPAAHAGRGRDSASAAGRTRRGEGQIAKGS